MAAGRWRLPLLVALALVGVVSSVVADEIDDGIAAAWKAYQGGDVAGAIAGLERLKKTAPGDVRPNSKLAFLLLASDGDPARVFELLLQHLRVHRDDQWALQSVAITAERALAVGRPEVARDCAKVLREAQPDKKEHRYLWARASYRLGKLAAVAEACRSLIDEDPSWELPYRLLARVLLEQGAYEQAVQVYRDLLEDSPGNVDVRLSLARAQLMEHDYDRAEESYRSALEIAEPGSPLREMAEVGISVVAEQRALTRRLRHQSAFLDRMLLIVGGAWGLGILLLVYLTRRRD